MQGIALEIRRVKRNAGKGLGSSGFPSISNISTKSASESVGVFGA